MPNIKRHFRRTPKGVTNVREHFRSVRPTIPHGDRVVPSSENNGEINEYAIKSALRDIDWKIQDLEQLAIEKRAIMEDDTQILRQIQRLEDDKEHLKSLV